MIRFAEFVFPGHPDKLCDAIADGIVAAARSLERRALVGVEVGVHTDNVFITGRVASAEAETLDVDAIVHEVYQSAGYSDEWIPDPSKLTIHKALCLETLQAEESDARGVADDQSICTGYAIALPETNYLPPAHYLANRLGRRISELYHSRPELGLGPDGKLIVTLQEEDGRFRLHALSCSVQQRNMVDSINLRRTLRELVEAEMQALADSTSCFHAAIPDTIDVNGAGKFEIGGPEGDNGLTGKKLVVDAYGPHVPIGGGALSGKDFFKVDRAGALHARRIAKAVVMTGGVREALVHLSWHPGSNEGDILTITTGDGETVAADRWRDLFDLSLEVSGECWGDAIDLVEIARYGHFTDGELPWEQVRFADHFAQVAA